MKRLVIILIGISLSLCLVFIVINLSINLFERKFKKVDYDALIEYCQQHKLSENYANIVDFNMPSGRHRFFVCDLKKQRIITSGLCAHGAGGESTSTNPVFSNEMLCGGYRYDGRDTRTCGERKETNIAFCV